MNDLLRYYHNITRKDILDKVNIENPSEIFALDYIDVYHYAKDKQNISVSESIENVIDRYLFIEFLVQLRLNMQKEGLASSGFTRLRKNKMFNFLTLLYIYFYLFDASPLSYQFDVINKNYFFDIPWVNRFGFYPDEHYNIQNDIYVRVVFKECNLLTFRLIFSGLRLGNFFVLV